MAFFQHPSVDIGYAKSIYNTSLNPHLVYAKNACMYIEKQDRRYLVVIRGSDGITDWLQNGMRWSVRFLGALVHAGFLAHMLELAPIFENRDNDKSLPVYLVGHSLGGAAAVLLGTKIAATYPDREVRIVTFGAPRTGQKSFRVLCSRLTNLYIRQYRHRWDIVTRLPSFGFVDCGQIVILRPKNTTPFAVLKNHRVSNYFQILHNL